jgi:hypothetical protein
VTCEYPTKSNETRLQSVQRLNQELQERLDAYSMIFEKLRSGSPDTKESILTRLTAQASLDDIVREFEGLTSSGNTTNDVSDNEELDNYEAKSSSQLHHENQYDTFQKTHRYPQLQEHMEFLEHLRNVPDEEAIDIIRRLRATNDTSSVLATIKGGASTAYRLSELETARSILPPTETSIEFELGSVHGMVYPVLTPIEVDSIDVDVLLREAPRKLRKGLSPSPDNPSMGPEGSVSPLRGVPARRSSPFSGPLETPSWCDNRLGNIQFDYWTKVPIDNTFAANTISMYLENDHAILGFFDPDLILDDLVNKRLNFCSPFLLNSLLYLACVCELVLR